MLLPPPSLPSFLRPKPLTGQEAQAEWVYPLVQKATTLECYQN